MGTPNRDELKDKAEKGPGKDEQNELEEAEGEVQQKSGGQKRQAGEAVEDVREKIRRNQPR
ncbi:MAG TPA: hypothetical protein VEY33_03090 [Gemmatimonadota bacterium]|nr:hypothetical protein [Gemmatimonadota bacterium]